MDAARWERVQAAFHATADLPEPERSARLERECAGDASLMADVRRLFEEDSTGSLLDEGVAGVAHRMLEGRGVHPPPGASFGHYQIGDMLGEGGMGVVYLAHRQDLGSVAAIKILRDSWLSPARRERFASEQRTLAQLHHPSIAQLYDADTLPDGTPWFVMEYVEGVPLTTYCRTHQTSIQGRLRLLRAVCEAVQHAHQHAIIHRDLKPSNILVKADGTVKLLDFGIAKHLVDTEGAADQTVTGLRLMTPAYAAPEQIRGSRVGIHTDVYALGVVLYELLTGRLPFDVQSCTPAEAERRITEKEAEKPSVVAKNAEPLPAGGARPPALSRSAWSDLDVLCLTAMHKDPERRYRTVDALIQDIDHFLAGQPLEARPDSVRYRFSKFVARNRGPVVAATLAALLVIGLVVFYTVRLTRARNAALAEAARTQRIQSFMSKLFEGGDEAVGPSDTLRVISLVERGVQEARSLDGEHEVQAELYQTLGDIYQKLGKLPRADTLLRAALDMRRKIFGPEHPDVAASIIALGLLRDAQAEYDTAEALVRQGLAMSKRLLAADHPAIPRGHVALALVLEEKGEYDQAITELQEAVRLQTAHGAGMPDLIESMYHLANNQFYAGHYASSDTISRRVLAMTRSVYGDHHPMVAEDLINLGAIQYEWGHYADAEKLYRQALDIDRAWYGEKHPETASVYTMIGRALVHQEKYDEAVQVLEQALTIQRTAYGEVHPRVASVLNDLGSVALAKKNFDQAEFYFRQMVDTYTKIYNGKHYLIGTALSNLASVFNARKEFVKAEALYRQALARFGETLPADHLYIGIARVKLGRSLLGQHRYGESENEILAGYAILRKQTSPSVSWLRAARLDLIAVYDSLKQPDKAARYRAELADTSNSK